MAFSRPVLPQKTWKEMHDEFHAEPPKNPGKILLLYSPDTTQFKELQVRFANEQTLNILNWLGYFFMVYSPIHTDL